MKCMGRVEAGDIPSISERDVCLICQVAIEKAGEGIATLSHSGSRDSIFRMATQSLALETVTPASPAAETPVGIRQVSLPRPNFRVNHVDHDKPTV